MARTIRTKLYKFSELSKPAKQKAIEWWKEGEDFSNVYDEAFESLKIFAKVFGIQIRDYDFQEHYRSSYYFELEDNILELSGQRLATYIWNNYKTDIYKPKFIGCVELDKQIFHNRVRSERLTSPGRRVDWFNPYYSGCQIVADCPFTGVCYDYDLIQPLIDFMDKPTAGTDFKELLQDCILSLNKSVKGEIEGQNEDAYISETIEANEYEFLKDGTKY